MPQTRAEAKGKTDFTSKSRNEEVYELEAIIAHKWVSLTDGDIEV